MEGFMSPFDFGGASFLPQMPQLNAQGMPDLPTMMSQQMAQAGIRPQDFLQNPAVAKLAVPQAAAPPPMQNTWDPTPVQGPGPPSPMPPQTLSSEDASRSTQTPEAMDATNPMNANAKATGVPPDLRSTLQNLKAPAPPQAQQIRTPQAPAPHASRALPPSHLLALLSALGAGGAKAPTGIPLPLKF